VHQYHDEFITRLIIKFRTQRFFASDQAFVINVSAMLKNVEHGHNKNYEMIIAYIFVNNKRILRVISFPFTEIIFIDSAMSFHLDSNCPDERVGYGFIFFVEPAAAGTGRTVPMRRSTGTFIKT